MAGLSVTVDRRSLSLILSPSGPSTLLENFLPLTLSLVLFCMFRSTPAVSCSRTNLRQGRRQRHSPPVSRDRPTRASCHVATSVSWPSSGEGSCHARQHDDPVNYERWWWNVRVRSFQSPGNLKSGSSACGSESSQIYCKTKWPGLWTHRWRRHAPLQRRGRPAPGDQLEERWRPAARGANPDPGRISDHQQLAAERHRHVHVRGDQCECFRLWSDVATHCRFL